jgi:hypothetical protein
MKSTAARVQGLESRAAVPAAAGHDILFNMGLHIAAWILVHWLLGIAWLDPGRISYALWAGVVLILWWSAWSRRNPPWPTRPEQRMAIYALFTFTIFGAAFLMGRWQGYFVLLELIALWVADRLLRAQRAA